MIYYYTPTNRLGGQTVCRHSRSIANKSVAVAIEIARSIIIKILVQQLVALNSSKLLVILLETP